MTHDELLVAGLVAAFAGMVTAHLALVAGLSTRRPWWKGVIALLVPPLAPYWGARAGMYKRTVAWVVCAIGYVSLHVIVR